MRFLVDECAGPYLGEWLASQGNEVFSIYEEASSIDDESILGKAYAENWILITFDKDFGDMAYLQRRPHRGVALLRLEDQRPANAINAVRGLLESHPHQLPDEFVVVPEGHVRFAGI